MKSLLTVALAAVVASSAGAATYTTHSGFGPVGSISSCKDGSATGAFTTGQVLGAGDVTGGCVGFYTIDLDTTAKTITLTSAQYGNYESNTLDIAGITGVTITSLTTLSYLPLFNPAFYGNPATYGGLPAPVTSFTGSSISISFSTYGEMPPQFTFNDAPGQAVFAYNATQSVPEPAMWTLMIGGFGLVGAALRRRRPVAA